MRRTYYMVVAVNRETDEPMRIIVPAPWFVAGKGFQTGTKHAALVTKESYERDAKPGVYYRVVAVHPLKEV